MSTNFSEKTVSLFSRGHERVVFFQCPQTKLKAIVGIHDTTLGPALGGCRVRAYKTENEAIDDVLRLSEGMTYKNALADLPLGGGKSCIIADPSMVDGRRELFFKFGECLNTLQGVYITAEDMGTTVADLTTLRSVSKFAAGYAQSEGGSGDPSPWTAKGVFQGILAALEIKFGSQSLEGKRFLIQGVGNVGGRLVEHLITAGAKCIITDTKDARIQNIKSKYDVEAVEIGQCYDVVCDVFSPCAVGQTVNHETLQRLHCSIIAGAANNQLIDNSVAPVILSREITYCPDFAINAGGVISICGEVIEGGWKYDWVNTKVQNIYTTVRSILETSKKIGIFSEEIALRIAREKILKHKKTSTLSD
jgi:leucine dehydrogenase